METPIQTINKDKSALDIQELHAGFTKELLFKEFSKYGQIKEVKHFLNTSSAYIAYENSNDAEKAMRQLNHTHILNKEISISYFEDKDAQNYQKKFNLFIMNVPSNLDTSVLHNFLESEFGNVASLILKKKNESQENLGYGYAQFEKEEDFNKILKRQEVEGKITIKDSQHSFNVWEFSTKKPKTKTNKICITDLFENEIPCEEKEVKGNQIVAVFEEIKRHLGDEQDFTFHTNYNDQNNNFQTMVEFSYSNSEDEISIYQIVKQSILQNFKNTNLPGGPQIFFNSHEISRRNFIQLEVKNTINEAILSAWFLRVLGIVIPKQNIYINHHNFAKKVESIHQPTDESKPASTSRASLFFDSKKNGLKFILFCSKSKNTDQIKEICNTKHKRNLFMNPDTYNSIKNIYQNMNIIYLNCKEDLTNNVFVAFQKLSPEQKILQVEEFAQLINICKDEFNQISDEEGKLAILGQIIYYKIQNFGEATKQELIQKLGKTPKEASQLINLFHQEVAKITGMLVDKDIFTIEEILEIVLSPQELLERCLEAADLLTENQQN